MPKTFEELRYVEHFNKLIISKTCEFLSSTVGNSAKIKIDCIGPEEIRIRFYNYFNEDKQCIKDD